MTQALDMDCTAIITYVFPLKWSHMYNSFQITDYWGEITAAKIKYALVFISFWYFLQIF